MTVKNFGELIGEEHGHALFYLHISYNCPSLKLWGYSTERKLRNAVAKKVKLIEILVDERQRTKGGDE